MVSIIDNFILENTEQSGEKSKDEEDDLKYFRQNEKDFYFYRSGHIRMSTLSLFIFVSPISLVPMSPNINQRRVSIEDLFKQPLKYDKSMIDSFVKDDGIGFDNRSMMLYPYKTKILPDDNKKNGYENDCMQSFSSGKYRTSKGISNNVYVEIQNLIARKASQSAMSRACVLFNTTTCHRADAPGISSLLADAQFETRNKDQLAKYICEHLKLPRDLLVHSDINDGT